MKFFTDCSGDCKDCLIHHVGCCIAGHGDDDFYLIREEDAKNLIEEGNLEQNMIDELKIKFPKLNF